MLLLLLLVAAGSCSPPADRVYIYIGALSNPFDIYWQCLSASFLWPLTKKVLCAPGSSERESGAARLIPCTVHHFNMLFPTVKKLK